jgi:hypothetical protein
MTTDDITRKAALKLLRNGVASPSEVAKLAGISRQLMRFWITDDKLNWRKARAAALSKAWRRVSGA